MVCAILTLLGACKDNTEPADNTDATPKSDTTAYIPVIPHDLVKTYPHDTTLFTEGLLVHKGQLFESTGSPEEFAQTRSVIGISDLQKGKFTTKIELDKHRYFGEGIAILNDKLYQLTYKNREGFIYDLATFKQTGTFTYTNEEGWGMTTDGKQLIMSDGTDALTFLNPADMKPVKTLKVIENGMALPYLNELEYINGYLYANVWMTNFIVKIDPSSGKVLGRLDLNPIAYDAKTKSPGAEVLNGIAYDAAADKIYVTGKMWAHIYEIRFAH